MNSNQIIHKHVHVDYNPLKGMLVHISSLKLSIVPYAAGPETQGHSRTVYGYILMSNCFPSFIVHWIFYFVNQSTHENHKQNWYPTKKSDFTVSEHCLKTDRAGIPKSVHIFILCEEPLCKTF